jgi:hypothetical protein
MDTTASKTNQLQKGETGIDTREPILNPYQRFDLANSQ